MRDPLNIHWPDGLPADAAGTVRSQFHHVSDLAPTVLEVVGVGLPDTVNGVTQMPLHGTPMTYTFVDADAPTRKAVQHFEMLGHRGLVADGWKAVTLHDARTSINDDRWEHYHLDNDFAETVDLADAHPDLLRSLVDRWWEEAAMYDVLAVDERAGGGTRKRRPVRTQRTLWPGLEG